MIEEAKAALDRAETPRRRLAALGLAAKAQEAVLTALRGDLQVLADRRSGLDQSREEQEARLAAVLAAIQRIERSPRAAAIAWFAASVWSRSTGTRMCFDIGHLRS